MKRYKYSKKVMRGSSSSRSSSSRRSEQILGLITNSDASQNEQTTASVSKCLKQDTGDIPMRPQICEDDIENVNPCDTEVSLGLITKSDASQNQQTTASVSKCVKQDTGDIPMRLQICEDNIQNVNPCDTEEQMNIEETELLFLTNLTQDWLELDHTQFNNDAGQVIAETDSPLELENNILPVTETKISLVPDYDSESTSNVDDEENTIVLASVISTNFTRRLSSSSLSSNKSSSSSCSSSSNSDSSSSSEQTDKQAQDSSTPATDLAVIVTHTPELQDTMGTTAQNDLTSADTTSVSNVRKQRVCAMNGTITISPRYTDESDLDDDVDDPTYNFEDKFANASDPRTMNFLLPSSSNYSSSDSDSSNQNIKKGRKRVKNPSKWRQNRVKRLRNEGESYKSMSKTQKIVSARCLKIPCTNCKLNCTQNVDHGARYDIFNNFWKLGDLSNQRSFISSCMVDIKPKYKYTNAENPRRPNKAFFFTVNGERVRVCKTFFKSTLDITDRMIHTIRTNTNEHGFLMEERRGKHGHNKKINPELVAEIKKHIDSIPRIESHYVRAQTTREYIDGGKTIKDLYKDFVDLQTENGKETGNYMTYYKIFTTEYNLSFFRPKKDQCDLCVSYENSNCEQKLVIEDKYRVHLKEKGLSREEKLKDRIKADKINKVVIYDLEAVLQCPRGETSAFYYKSKLNSYNLTLTELKNKDNKNAYDNVYCYFWTEVDAKRGAIEIGSCVWEYLKKISGEEGTEEKNVIFYSDNCCGQNKNKFIATLYLYAVQQLNINSIVHKFLITGHTQNEADSVHSLIEKEVKKNLKSGPIYTPDQYITLIKSAKKSSPVINVHEMTFDSFMDIKELQEDWGYNFTTNTDGQTVNWNDIKHLKMTKGKPFTFSYKNSYEDEYYKEVNVRNKRKKMKDEKDIALKQAYTEKQKLSANKKKDLRELLTKGLIPAYYANFYNMML